MSIPLDLSITPDAMMYRLLTASTNVLPSGSVLSENDITFSDITAVSGRDDDANTQITLTPVVGSTLVYGNDLIRYYARKNFNDVATQMNFSLAVTDDLNYWTAARVNISALNYLQKLYPSLGTGDLLVSSPVSNADGSLSVVVSPRADHLTLTGALTLVITSDTPDPTPSPGTGS